MLAYSVAWAWRALPAWQPPTPALRQLRALSRERQSLTQQTIRLKAQRYAYQPSYQSDARTLARLADQLQLLDQQLGSHYTRNGKQR